MASSSIDRTQNSRFCKEGLIPSEATGTHKINNIGEVMGSVREVEGKEEFEEEIREGTVVMQFHAEWCQPCKVLAPRFEAASDRAGGRWCRVSVDTLDADTLNKYKIQSVPTLIKFVDGAVETVVMGRTANDILSEVRNGR